jgi:hypothetical protein
MTLLLTWLLAQSSRKTPTTVLLERVQPQLGLRAAAGAVVDGDDAVAGGEGRVQ